MQHIILRLHMHASVIHTVSQLQAGLDVAVRAGLHMASANGHADIIQLLVERGAVRVWLFRAPAVAWSEHGLA